MKWTAFVDMGILSNNFPPFRVAIGTTVILRTILMTWRKPMEADAHSKRKMVKGMAVRSGAATLPQVQA